MTKKHLYLTISATLFSFFLSESSLKATYTCPQGPFTQAGSPSKDKYGYYVYTFKSADSEGWTVTNKSESSELTEPTIVTPQFSAFPAKTTKGDLQLTCQYDVVGGNGIAIATRTVTSSHCTQSKGVFTCN